MVVAARWACVVAFKSIALWDMPTWVQAVKNSYDTGGTASILTAAKEPDVLFLDDVGAEQGNQPWLSDLYYQIINSRYVAQQTIVATTNLTAGELLARYQRAADRLLEITGLPIQMDGQSYRQLRLAGEV
jgi:DNA replication protein DnaC